MAPKTIAETTNGAVAFILKGYPRLSETFIAKEIEALERRGLDIRIISLRHPTDRDVHPVHGRIRAPINYLPEYLYQEPLRVWRAWRQVRRWPSYKAVRRLWLADLWRDRTPNRIRRFGQAMVLASELGPEIGRLHAHFLHTPASVTRYAAHLRARPWSCSAHAKDIWTTPEWEKREKLADLDWLTTCSQAAHDHLAALAPDGNRSGTVALVYHGIDLDQFGAAMDSETWSSRDGGEEAEPLRLLSVGRAVAKKGYDDLIAALATLPPSLHWRLEHIGGGNLSEKLRRQAQQAGIAEHICWRGAQPQEAVLAAYRNADIFILASRVAADGDRDGLPNVLMEAQSQGLACIATAVSAIPELITDGSSGVLVEGGDRAALATAISALAADPARRRRLGKAGQDRVRNDFSHDYWIGRLASKFDLPRGEEDLRGAAQEDGPGGLAREA
ncbi:MAG: glycosyltransferase family 4 protein [Alphaproteobacteria bacterium]|jgi:glycosyltransferase involved in cell wall biosynthesis|nr:glycosyltransferase family 4 protein [Alphaproteobacteria bacterium]MDP6831157.1 glycosyltransferase family 4 protein [Alphaproteobacteria bacterium]